MSWSIDLHMEWSAYWPSAQVTKDWFPIPTKVQNCDGALQFGTDIQAQESRGEVWLENGSSLSSPVIRYLVAQSFSQPLASKSCDGQVVKAVISAIWNVLPDYELYPSLQDLLARDLHFRHNPNFLWNTMPYDPGVTTWNSCWHQGLNPGLLCRRPTYICMPITTAIWCPM